MPFAENRIPLFRGMLQAQEAAAVALKVELKPNERIILGNIVLRNGPDRARFFIDGTAPILREKDILTPETADTPAKRIYLAVQLMYLAGESDSNHEVYFSLVNDFLSAAPSALPLITEINNRILNGDHYKALKAARELVAYETRLLDHAQRSPSLRPDSANHAERSRSRSLRPPEGRRAPAGGEGELGRPERQAGRGTDLQPENLDRAGLIGFIG